jgi:uncharacterized low-complexity protein
MRYMMNYPVLITFAALILATLMIATFYQHQANAQTITSIQNQTDGHSQSSICINGVCTNGTCTNDNCETSIRCVNGKCERLSVTNEFP